ncbi:MAG: response regulator transcription factor [Rhodocyclaceae bacterium]|nr:response regulator transcription factor [Rhodocyclaceae bacterium]
MAVRTIVADDHALFRSGLIRMLAELPDIRVVAEAADGDQTLAAVAGVAADLLILDLTMPGPTGVPLIEKIRVVCPQLPILILSMHDEPVTVRRALRAGASGYVTKNVDIDILGEAIRSVTGGEQYVDPNLAVGLAFTPRKTAGSSPGLGLTNRELEVLTLIVEGMALKDIAERLNLSPKTVTTHKANLMDKLGIENNAELIRYALERGLL